jgi:hypothetical protein
LIQQKNTFKFQIRNFLKNKKMRLTLLLLFISNLLAAQPGRPEPKLSLSKPSGVQVYDYQEFTISLPKIPKGNPYVDARVTGTFTCGDSTVQDVEGFCDAADGNTFRMRYMPTRAGQHRYTVTVAWGEVQKTFRGTFLAQKSTRNGPLRVDAAHPWHLQYEGSGQHFFWNATTAYWMLGWRSDTTMLGSLNRLADLGVNRIRVAINGRAHGGSRWNEVNVVECPEFTFKLNPWVAERPDDLDNPGFDVTRFNLAHWQKLDRLVALAQARGVVVSLIFYVDGLDHGCDPFKKPNMGNPDEQRYYRYAVARYAAFENVMWDVTNEYHLFRSEDWVNKMGLFLKKIDPYKHLISVHGHSDFPFRTASWVDVVLYQSWDECGGYDFMTECRAKQAATGRPLPQINEEYGYEGHYSVWGCGATAGKLPPDGRDANNRRQLAWEICMAGGYQTTGERADDGTGAGKNTGGGWINGRGNNSMILLGYHRILAEVFTEVEYWRMEPHPELVAGGNLCLATPGEQYLVYARLPHCRLRLPAGQRYSVVMIDPRTGQRTPQPDADSDVDNGAWQYRRTLSGEDWVFVLKRLPK